MGWSNYPPGEYFWWAHVKRAYNLPSDYTHPDSVWHINRVVNEAITLAQTYPSRTGSYQCAFARTFVSASRRKNQIQQKG
jgi:hypothetical protein